MGPWSAPSAGPARPRTPWRPDNAEERRTVAVELRNVADHSGDWQMSLQGRIWQMITALELGDPQA